jgi:hypothetical protein
MCSKAYNFNGFVGDFKELLIQFVQLKQSLGFHYTTDACRHVKTVFPIYAEVYN